MNLIADILQRVDQAVLGYTAQAYQGVVNAFSTELYLMLVLYVAIFGISVMSGFLPLTMKQVVKHLLTAFIVFELATNWGSFSIFFYDVFTQGPEDLTAALVEGAKPTTQLSVFYDVGTKAGDKILEAAGTLDVSQTLLGYSVILATVLVVAFALFLFILAKVGLAILLALGPIFISLAMWKPTKGLFQGWINYLVNYALIPLLTTAILGLIMTMIQDGMAKMQALGDSPKLFHTFPFLLTAAIAVLLLAQVKSMAASLGGGIALSTMGAFGNTLSAPWRFARKMGRGAQENYDRYLHYKERRERRQYRQARMASDDKKPGGLPSPQSRPNRLSGNALNLKGTNRRPHGQKASYSTPKKRLY